MTAAQLMLRHPETWVRLITLERDLHTPRDELLRRALDQEPDPTKLNDLLKSWQRQRLN